MQISVIDRNAINFVEEFSEVEDSERRGAGETRGLWHYSVRKTSTHCWTRPLYTLGIYEVVKKCLRQHKMRNLREAGKREIWSVWLRSHVKDQLRMLMDKRIAVCDGRTRGSCEVHVELWGGDVEVLRRQRTQAFFWSIQKYDAQSFSICWLKTWGKNIAIP